MAVRVWVDVLTDRKRRLEDDDSVINRRRNRDEKRVNVEPAFEGLFEAFYGRSSDGGLVGMSAGQMSEMGGESGRGPSEEFAKTVKIRQLVLEILIKNQVLYVSPSVEVSDNIIFFSKKTIPEISNSQLMTSHLITVTIIFYFF